jgi:hypothetical protein
LSGLAGGGTARVAPDLVALPTGTFALFFLVVRRRSARDSDRAAGGSSSSRELRLLRVVGLALRLPLAACTLWTHVRRRIARGPGAVRRGLLAVAVAGDLALLATGRLRLLASWRTTCRRRRVDPPLATRAIVLPVGISFFAHGDQPCRTRTG